MLDVLHNNGIFELTNVSLFALQVRIILILKYVYLTWSKCKGDRSHAINLPINPVIRKFDSWVKLYKLQTQIYRIYMLLLPEETVDHQMLVYFPVSFHNDAIK